MNTATSGTSSAALPGLPESALTLGALREQFAVSRQDLILLSVLPPIAAIGIGAIFFVKMLAVVPAAPWAVWLCALPCIGISLIIAREGYRTLTKAHARSGMRVLLFDEGFISFRPNDVFSCRWDDVEWTRELFATIENCPIWEGLIVHLRTGQEWTLDRRDFLRDSSRLAATIQQDVARRMLPQVLADLRKGQTLDFGAIQLTLLGIMHRELVLSWADLTAIAPHGANFKIQRRGAWRAWATIAARDLINRFLLLAIVEAMRSDQRN